MSIFRDSKRSRASVHSQNENRKILNLIDKIKNKNYFQSAVVVDFVTDPDEFLNETVSGVMSSPNAGSGTSLIGQFNNIPQASVGSMKKTLLEYYSEDKKVINTNLLEVMPRNSIIGYNISDGNAQKKNRYEVFFPFFPPHFSLPVNSGEQVWVFYENFGDTKIGYWMFRKPGTKFVDDINYTHLERQTVINRLDRSLKNESNKSKIQNLFDENALTFDAYNLEGQNSGTKLDYGDLKNRSLSHNDFIGEPVPRYSKKSADLVLQGSNNTIILLSNEEDFNTGCIKLVAGRDKLNLETVTNVDGYDEADKLKLLKRDTPRSDEGIIDPMVDSASIIISEKDGGSVRIGNSVGAYIELKSNGDICIVPAGDGVIRMGSEDADKAIMGQTGVDLNGSVKASGLILTSAGGVLGEGDPSTYASPAPLSGKFASKILVK